MTEKKENLKKKGGFVPSFRLGEMITGRGKTTFGRTVRNFVLLLSLVAVLILILLGGHLITKPKPALITLEAIKIAREKISELPERGLSAADVYKQGETKAYPHEDVKRLIITPSEIKAMELEKERARLAREKAAEEARKAALGITEPPKEEEKEEEKRDAFGFARAAEVGVRKAVKAAAPRPTVIPRMSSAKSVGGISVPSGASTVAAFRKLEIPKAKGKIYIPPPKSKSYVLSAGQKIERIAPGITSYRGTDKLIGDKWKLAEAGEKMDVGEAAKAAEATKEFLKSQPAGQPTGGKASFGGGISASPKIGGSFSPWIRPLDEELKLIHEKNKLALEKMAAEKALGLEYEWKKIPAVAAAAAAGEAAKAVGGELGGILAAPLSAFKDVVTEAFGITGGPTKWTCKIDAVSATSPIPPFPTPFGMTPGSPGSPFVPCKCMGSVAAKGPGDPPYDSLVTQCMGQRPPGKVGKLAECKKFCP